MRDSTLLQSYMSRKIPELDRDCSESHVRMVLQYPCQDGACHDLICCTMVAKLVDSLAVELKLLRPPYRGSVSDFLGCLTAEYTARLLESRTAEVVFSLIFGGLSSCQRSAR